MLGGWKVTTKSTSKCFELPDTDTQPSRKHTQPQSMCAHLPNPLFFLGLARLSEICSCCVHPDAFRRCQQQPHGRQHPIVDACLGYFGLRCICQARPRCYMPKHSIPPPQQAMSGGIAVSGPWGP